MTACQGIGWLPWKMDNEYKYAVVDLSDNSTTVSTKPALVIGIYINTVLSAHTVVLKDDTAPVLTLVASLAAGTMVDIPPIRFETNLIVDPNDSSTGNLTIFYRDLRA